MTWLKTDDGYYDHAKIAELSSHEYKFHHGAQLLASRFATDGRITHAQAESLRRPGMPTVNKMIGHLVEVGLWHRAGDGYEIHDFLQYNPSKASIEENRRAEAERKAEARAAKAKLSGKSPPGHSPDTDRSPEVVREKSALPDPTRPDLEKGQDICASGDARARGPSFAEFWGQYPRKQGKKRAQTSWGRLSVENRRLAIDRLGQYVASVSDPAFLKHGDTYLSQQPWHDFDPVDEVVLSEEDELAAMALRNEESLARWERANFGRESA